MRRFTRVRAARAEIADVIVRSEIRLGALNFSEATLIDENFDYAYTWGMTHGMKAALMIVNGSTAEEAIDAMSKRLSEGIEPE